MTNFQFYILAQAYGSGVYGGESYQCKEGENCETQTDVTAPSTGVLKQGVGFDYAVMAAILVVSLIVAGAVVYLKKRIAKKQ